MKKRILIFSLAYFPHVGGAEIAIKEITDRLGGEYDFDLITLNLGKKLPKNEKIGNVNVYRIGNPFPKEIQKYLFPLTGFWQALTLSSQNKYDAIWCVMVSYHFISALFFKLINPNTPLILTLQEGDPISHIKRRALPVWPLFRLLFSKASVIQAISKYLGDFALNMGANCPVEIVPNGVNIEHFSREYKEKPLDKKAGDIFLITTSRLTHKNGVADIIESLVHLPKEVKLIILGTGELEEKLKEKAHALSVFNRVSFLGYVPHDILPAYLHQSDIFIRPSYSEGFGNSFVEAMAAGLPVIATQVGGIVDFLEEGRTGLFCEVKNPKSIAYQVELLMHDPKLYKRLVINGYTMVKEKYTWDKVAIEMKSRIFSIL